jgi:hypothetical protein
MGMMGTTTTSGCRGGRVTAQPEWRVSIMSNIFRQYAMYQNNRDRGSCIPPTNRKILGFVINIISSILSTVTAVLLSNGRGSI